VSRAASSSTIRCGAFGERLQPLAAPRHQHDVVLVGGEQLRQLEAQPR